MPEGPTGIFHAFFTPNLRTLLGVLGDWLLCTRLIYDSLRLIKLEICLNVELLTLQYRTHRPLDHIH